MYNCKIIARKEKYRETECLKQVFQLLFEMLDLGIVIDGQGGLP